MSQALANYGLMLVSCNERLREFNSVTDAYLTIFLMLGGLGLLIGLFGDRVGETNTLLAIGFNAELVKRQLFRESMFVPVYAVIAGTVAALVAVTSAIPAVSIFTWATMLAIIASLLLIAWRSLALAGVR
jgi:putative ABC transport system permease protein